MKSQEDRLVHYRKANNIAVLQVIREDHSAKTFNRPEWEITLKSLIKTERPDLLKYRRKKIRKPQHKLSFLIVNPLVQNPNFLEADLKLLVDIQRHSL